MAALAGTTDTYSSIGQAEDVADVIYNISPTETPVMTAAKRIAVSAKTYEWQTDALATAANNKQVEGDDATFASASPTVLLQNRCQISSKTVMVSRTLDRVKKYGRGKELAYQTTKRSKELKRDIETALLGQQGSSAGSSSVARATAGFGAMIVNRRFASGTGTNTTGTVAGFQSGDWTLSVDGTVATFVEADLKDALEQAWTDGGEPTMLVTNSKQKQRMAGFVGASAFEGFQVSQGRVQGAVIGGVDVYVSDYGSHKVVLDRFIGQTAVLCLDPEYMAIGWLDPIQISDLAKTGDAEKKLLVGEWVAVLTNPDAHAQIRGCLTT